MSTDTTDRFGTEVAQSIETIEGTWEYDGKEFDLICEDISKSDFDLVGEYFRVAGLARQGESEKVEEIAEDLEDFSWEDESEEDKDAIESVVDEKLKKPDVEVAETGIQKLTTLYIGMMQAWQESPAVDKAREDMPLDKGNR